MAEVARPISLRLAPRHIEALKARAQTLSGTLTGVARADPQWACRRRWQGPRRAADTDRAPTRGPGRPGAGCGRQGGADRRHRKGSARQVRRAAGGAVLARRSDVMRRLKIT